MQMQKISSEQYLRHYVRGEDYNLYLLHFFVPRESRTAILALMGLHSELTSIPHKATDPTMRLIRLQWWRDEIAKDSHADSPILNSLPKLDYEDFINRFDQSLRGEDVDIDETFYALMTSAITSQKQKDKFTKRLMLHDQLEETAIFRAMRLWLGV